MSLLITGAGGLLGSNLVQTARDRGYDVVGTHHSDPSSNAEPKAVQMDLTDTERFRDLLADNDVSTVINCAAMTDVDECEREPTVARRINGETPGHLATVCNELGVQFCQISTDYVFSDPDIHPIPERSEPAPIQTYGEAKLCGERRVRHSHGDPLIARVSFLFGVHRLRDELVGLPAWIYHRLRERQTVPLYTDQHVSPTFATTACEAILALLSSNATGTYHCSNAGCVTPYEFGQEIVDVYGQANGSLLSKTSLRERHTGAERPTHVCLSTDKLERFLDRPQPSWSDGLQSVAEYFT